MRLRDILGCSLLAVGLVACGGAQKPSSGLQAGTKDVPPPPDVANVKPDAPKPVVAEDTAAS